MGFELQLDVPRQQFADLIGFVISDHVQDVGEVFLGIDVIELGRAQKTVECGGSVATVI